MSDKLIPRMRTAAKIVAELIMNHRRTACRDWRLSLSRRAYGPYAHQRSREAAQGQNAAA